MGPYSSMTYVLGEGEIWTVKQAHIEGKYHEETQGEDDHLQVEETSWNRSFSYSLILDL